MVATLPTLLRILAATLLNASILAAEAPAALWAKFITGPPDGLTGSRVVANPSGGFFYINLSDRPLTRFTDDGAIVWKMDRVRGLNDLAQTFDLDVLKNGDVVASFIVSGSAPAKLFGQTVTAGANYLARLTSGGNLVWLKEVSNGYIAKVKASPDGSFYVSGFGNGSISIGSATIQTSADSFFLARFNDSLIWSQAGQGGDGLGYSVPAMIPDASGDVFVVGGTTVSNWVFAGTTLATPGVFLARLDSLGKSRSVKTIFANSRFIEAARTSDGGFAILASQPAAGILFRSSVDGTVQWQRLVNGAAKSMALGSQIYVSGYNSFNWFLEAFDLQGNSLWRRDEPSRANSAAESVAVLSSGRVVIAGSAQPAGTFIDDFFLRDFSGIGVVFDNAFLAAFDPSPNIAPIFRHQPVSHVGIVGERVTLRAAVYSPQPAAFQWLKNNSPIPGGTAADLTIASLQVADAGEYRLVATNPAGEARSALATITVQSTIMTVLAGTGDAGLVNEVAPLAAKFRSPRFPVALPNSILVSESSNHVVRRVAASGVTTWAGVGQPAADSPQGLAVQNVSDLGTKVFLADPAASGVRAIFFSGDLDATTGMTSPFSGGVVKKPQSLACTDGFEFLAAAEIDGTKVWRLGEFDATILSGGSSGFVDGPASTAQFGSISGLAMDPRGDIYICDKGNHCIRKLTHDGTVFTLAGTNSPGLLDGAGADARFSSPSGIALDYAGNLYVTDTGNNALRRVSAAGNVITLATGLNAPEGVTVRTNGSIILADTGNHRLNEIRFTAAANLPRLSVSLEGGFNLILSGPSDTYYIESTAAVPAAADAWAFEAAVFVSDQPVVQPLDPPAGARFYRARTAQ